MTEIAARRQGQRLERMFLGWGSGAFFNGPPIHVGYFAVDEHPNPLTHKTKAPACWPTRAAGLILPGDAHSGLP